MEIVILCFVFVGVLVSMYFRYKKFEAFDNLVKALKGEER